MKRWIIYAQAIERQRIPFLGLPPRLIGTPMNPLHTQWLIKLEAANDPT